MKWIQEQIATNLESQLYENFKSINEELSITKEDAGVHWKCSVKLKSRNCTVHCFEYRYYKEIGEEYLINFRENDINIAYGRTRSIENVIQSCKSWLLENSLERLFEKFEFIEWEQRRIRYIENNLLISNPSLNRLERKIARIHSDIFEYSIYGKNRFCVLNGFGRNEKISFKFYWDNCYLFEVKENNLNQLALIIEKWLIENIEPSKLEEIFPFIDTGLIAKFYEKGQGIKGEFISSWISIENFYGEGIQRNINIAESILKIDDLPPKIQRIEANRVQLMFRTCCAKLNNKAKRA